MKCPKCNLDITEEMLVCPNCKKVLKLVCPKCQTINKTNLCKKCGFTIITKCHKCGKINQTISGLCSKCGFSTYTSVAINSSLIDEFACLTIEFPNLNDIKPALGSTKLEEKFRKNLDQLILNYVSEIDLTREIINDVYIIRFNKDDSFYNSANSAVKAAIEISNLITDLNFKLEKLKNITLQCKMAILKRDINSKPEEYKSGFDIKLIYRDKTSSKLLKSLQIITDSFVYEQVCDNFELSSLSANFIKNQMVMFFELILKKYIKIPVPKKEDKKELEAGKLNIFDDGVEEEEESKAGLFNVDAIQFNELKCTFVHTKSSRLISEVVTQLRKSPKKFLSIKGDTQYLPRTGELLSTVEKLGFYDNVVRITCYDGMKYKPYGFFYELIAGIKNYSQSPKLFVHNNFDGFKSIDPSGFIKDLVNLNKRTFPHPEDARYSFFDIFYEIFHSMDRTLVYIENFEKIDDTSYEILQFLLENFEELDVSYLVTTSCNYPVHKKSHFLLTNPAYLEITSKPTPLKEIIGEDIARYEKILDSFYMKKASQNTKGSVLYFDNVIAHLVENGLITLRNGIYDIANLENILIPPSIEELMARRIKFLYDEDETAYKLLCYLLLFDPIIDSRTLNLLGVNIETKSDVLNKLLAKNYIYIHKNNVYVQSYNLLRNSFLLSTPIELKQTIAQELLEKLFGAEVNHPSEVVLYKILRQDKKEFMALENLSKLNASLGDFSAYLNCSIKFLKLLDNHVSESSEKSIQEYKMEVYENISNLLYKYTPNEIHNIAQVILNNLEKTTDDKKIIELCNKMLQGCLIGGNYSHALDLVHKILTRFSNYSINPSDENFSVPYLLVSLVKIEVLFSMGNLKDCSEAGDEILNVINKENISPIKPISLTQKQFEDLIFEALIFIVLAKIILLRSEEEIKDFTEKVRTNMGRLPQPFEMALSLEKIIKKHKTVTPPESMVTEDKFSKIIWSITKAFNEETADIKRFADVVYQAKISAKLNKLSQVELFSDLLIGYSYFKLGQFEKASAIFYNVLEIATKNGLKLITYIDWYFISVLKLEQQELDIAFGIANNVMVQLEKDPNIGDFLFFLFRVLLAKILIAKNEENSAQLCLNNARFIKEKYGLNYDIE